MSETYKTKIAKLTGTDIREVSRKARIIYKNISSKTKRKPYIRSAYFNKEKVFIDYFWQHLQERNWRDKYRRLKLYSCAIDLIVNCTTSPTIVRNPNNHRELFYRFFGITKDKELFCVQIKENLNNKNKIFISVFPQ